MASPWAVLAEALVRVVVATPPNIVLPPIVGGAASLNLFTGVVGESGAGKDAADAAAEDAIDVGEIITCNPGSGEGVAHAYARSTRNGQEEIGTAILLNAAEIYTIAALRARRGSTLLPELRKAYMGVPLGFLYADPTKRLTKPIVSS